MGQVSNGLPLSLDKAQIGRVLEIDRRCLSRQGLLQSGEVQLTGPGVMAERVRESNTRRRPVMRQAMRSEVAAAWKPS